MVQCKVSFGKIVLDILNFPFKSCIQHVTQRYGHKLGVVEFTMVLNISGYGLFNVKCHCSGSGSNFICREGGGVGKLLPELPPGKF